MAAAWKRLLPAVSLLALLALHTSPSLAAEEIVFGPKDLTVSWLRLHLSFNTFPVDEPSEGALILSKKTPEKPIQGGFLFINSQFVPLHEFLQGEDISTEREVSLRSTNYFIVFLRGALGATLSVMVKKAAAVPPPEVTFWATPQTITPRETSTLEWTTAHADRVTIDPGLGEVSLSGSWSVSPERTTTYTLTAAGEGGITTKSVTIQVRVPPPSVTLSADPETVTAGESSMLSWNSVHGESAVLEPGIGFVALNGTVQVQPQETTTYTITVTGPGGEATARTTVTVTVISTMAIEIADPWEGDSISRLDVMVRGTVHNAAGAEVGVTVNGGVALVHGKEFAANGVTLEEGQNVITAVAVDGQGVRAETSVTVYAQMAQDALRILADPDSGIAPFSSTLWVESSFDFKNPLFSYSGPGEVEILENIDGNGYIARATVPGLYTIAVEVTDDEGRLHTASLLILAIDGEALDGLLKEKWNGMKEALVAGDIEGALAYFVEGGSRQRYRDIFALIDQNLPGGLSADARDLPQPLLVRLEGNSATYILAREEAGTMIEYNLYFLKSPSGLWKINEY